jgi:hypothetical protein
MAVLKAIEYATNSEFVSSWFNDTEEANFYPKPYFDISEWSESFSSSFGHEFQNDNDLNGDGFLSADEASRLWKLTKNSVTFKARSTTNYYENDKLVEVENRVNTATWKGNFEIKGDRITGGYVSAFERDWGRVGIIEITGFEYPIQKEAAAFAVFSLPEEITDKIEENLDFLKEGETYTFSTVYDTKSTADVQPIAKKERPNTLDQPNYFNKKSADKITNFNPSTDTLEIDIDSFDINNSATFAAGANKKEVKKVLAKQDFDFLYDQKKGGLYFNENGANKGFGDGGIIAILKGAPDLTASNLDFV